MFWYKCAHLLKQIDNIFLYERRDICMCKTNKTFPTEAIAFTVLFSRDCPCYESDLIDPSCLHHHLHIYLSLFFFCCKDGKVLALQMQLS